MQAALNKQTSVMQSFQIYLDWALRSFSWFIPLFFPQPCLSELESLPGPLMWLWGLEGGQRKEEKRAGGGMKEWKQHGSILLPEGDSFPAQKCLHSSFHTCQQSTLGEERLIGEMDSLSLHWNNQICWNLQEPAECPRPLQSPAGTPELDDSLSLLWGLFIYCLFLYQSNTDFVVVFFLFCYEQIHVPLPGWQTGRQL